MDFGTVLSGAQTLFASLQCTKLKEILSIFGYESRLIDFQRTVSTIQALFHEAEAKQDQLSLVQKKLIEDLQDAVFEADDLLDEFATLAKQKELMKDDGSLSEKVSHFFSPSKNPFNVAYKMSKGIKNIKKQLDDIAYNKQFDFKLDNGPIRNRRPETCSYVDAVNIIGREDDLEKIVGMLIDTKVETDVSFLSIVGMGGLGKTALAQLVYNDPRVTAAFPSRMWTCVSDQDQKKLDVKKILYMILKGSKEGSTLDEGSTMDQIQIQLKQRLASNRFLLVLDDVWTEDKYQWNELKKYLIKGQRGSRIVVTTRSLETGSMVGRRHMYELQGLSVEDSWLLFQRTAFESDESNPPNDLVEIGREIIGGCAQVPLAIRVLGSLLYGQNKSKWQSVQKIGLANLRESKDSIMPILELSYRHLEYPLKSCFSYCALFPKDYEIEKEMLISLWMAQGYIVPLDIGQSIEDAGEEYFLILLRRCFFQDIKTNEEGEIKSVKVHDLLHDMIMNTSRKESSATSTKSGELYKRIRHLSITWDKFVNKDSLFKTNIFLYPHYFDPNTFMKEDDLVARCSSLRALTVYHPSAKRLLNSTSKMLHLRYLSLERTYGLKVLPKSITKLCNLQTLILRGFKELPKDLSRLINLRVLDIKGCYKLKHMPRGMNKLKCLNRLSDYMVGSKKSCLSWNEWFDGLEDLKDLNNLKGHLRVHIRWPKTDTNVVEREYRRKGPCLRNNKEHLTQLTFYFGIECGRMDVQGETALMEDLLPPSSLQVLDVYQYHGSRMPVNWASLLPNLVKLHLSNCMELEYLANFGSAEQQVSFLPSLEELRLEILPKLKGWKRRGVGSEDSSNSQLLELPPFPHLKILIMRQCPEMTRIPVYPTLERLTLVYSNRRLQGVSNMERGDAAFKLKEVQIDNVAWLKSLPMEAFQCLEILRIYGDQELESLGEMKEVLRRCSSSLRHLEIIQCLKLRDCELSEEKEEGEDSIATAQSLLPSFHTLKFENLPTLVNLPNWMQFLHSLKFLTIYNCYEVESMPNWMPKLTSLEKLQVFNCSESLKRRCQKDPPGEDWPYIQHIPDIDLYLF